MKRGAFTETTLLVIGYGNTLRSDDAAGPLVAERISALGISGVRVLACQQLTPELAPEIAEASTVVFVDAAAEVRRDIVCGSLAPDDSCPVSTHATDPRALLALARELYGHAPTGWLLKVPAENFGHGDVLSELTQRAIEAAVVKIRSLIPARNL